jgi:hypothetical protein
MKKKHVHVLNRIMASIPQELLDNLVEMQPVAPTAVKISRRPLKIRRFARNCDGK